MGDRNDKCKHCGKPRGNHKADTFHCPLPGRGSFKSFHINQTFEEKPPQSWFVTRLIKETYEGFGDTREEAADWVNREGPGAATVQIVRETVVKNTGKKLP